MRKARIYYSRTDEFWRRGEKYKYLEENEHVGNIPWQELKPDAKHNWLTEGMRDEFETLVPLGTKETKSATSRDVRSIFKLYSNGVTTNRDDWAYDFQRDALARKMSRLIQNYNLEVARYSNEREVTNIDAFVNNEPGFIKWTDRLKNALKQRKRLEFSALKICQSLYRPFVKSFLYFDDLLVHRRYQQHLIFPIRGNIENTAICLTAIGNTQPFQCLMTNLVPNLHLTGDSQCFPFYTYDEDGSNRRENVTDWALEKFRVEYGDESISKWDVFYYVYAVLHHGVYRERYAANLKRELPRVPFVATVEDFRRLAKAGARLAEIHVDYEAQGEYPLERIETEGAALDWRVEKMRLSKDKTRIVYNDFLTLAGIPAAAFEYRLGNRSALEWMIDQYQVTTDKRSGITNDPNREDDPQYILRLLGQVITVSLETLKKRRKIARLRLKTLNLRLENPRRPKKICRRLS
jgi:predicted helicase